MDPVKNLQEGTLYEVTVGEKTSSVNDIAVESAPVTWTFTTTGGYPVLTATAPAEGATGVPVGQAVTATFDRNMDASTLTSSSFTLAKSGGSQVPATVVYNSETKTAILDPVANLEAGVRYIATLSSAVKSQTGQKLSGAPKTWSFTIAETDGGSGDGDGDGSGDGFPDVVPGVTPYAEAIAALADRSIVGGFPDGTFRSGEPVTRQQFAKMIVLTLELTVTGSEVCPYGDVEEQTGADPFYPSKYVAVCAEQGITLGKTPTTFKPYDEITHQQLISMIVRAGEVSGVPDSYTPTFTAAQFSIPEHFQNARRASYAGLLGGLIGVGPSYDFLVGSTRGECAQLLYNLIVMLES